MPGTRTAELCNGPLPPLDPQRILVLRLGALGDVVRTRFAFPGLRALYPRARIDWLVEDSAAEGLVGIVGLDETLVLPRRELVWRQPARAARRLAALVAEMRRRRYDLAIDFHGILKSALLARLAGIPRRVGYDRGLAREGSHRLLTDRAVIRPTHLSRFERNALLVEFLGGERPTTPPALVLPPETAPLVDLPERPLVLHPGTSAATAYKRWDAARYAELADRLWERAGIPAVVTWGPVAGEREVAEEVVERAGRPARLAPRAATLAELLRLLQGARLFIGSDSGPMHLACLVGTPVVVLFGPTDKVENAPFPGVPQRVLWQDVGCNPCRKGCAARACMAALRVEEVLKAALELVAAETPVD